MPLTRAELVSEQRGPLLVLLVIIPALVLAAILVHDQAAQTAAYQRDVRIAQLTRARAFRFILDEETGIRGFVATGEPVFLEPYTVGKAALPDTFRDLATRLSALGLTSAEHVADQERAINAEWGRSIAQPLLTSQPRSPATNSVMRHGKQLIDRARKLDLAMQNDLSEAATSADGDAERAISNSLIFSVVVVSLLTVGAALFGILRARSARSAFADRIRYENQKRIADSLQTAFLNKNLPITPNVGLHATYIPAMAEAQVGGDWYDAFELPDKRILFSIGDVAGHGLEAAVMMSRARQAIIAAALHENDPAKVLERANEAILLQEARMVTAICGYIDPATLEIVYATAGHPPPILVRPSQPASLLPHDGVPLGILPDPVYRTFVATACDAAILVLYTDGVIEHRRDIIEGEARLLEAAEAAMFANDPALAIHRHIFAASAASDDVAILTVRFKQPPGTEAAAASLDTFHHGVWETSAADPMPGTATAASDAAHRAEDDNDASLRPVVLVHAFAKG